MSRIPFDLRNPETLGGPLPPGRSSYDDVPYEGYAIPDTHPDSLATMGKLFGLAPPDIETCRVLELGCAEGGNLLAMAVTLPQARFLGIDASPRQIESGRARAREAQIGNVALEAMSILDFPEDSGEFDYILCHGVYSWVPHEVQDRILSIFERHLTPRGIAYLSYNTFPGWHINGMLREMMLFHVRSLEETGQRVQQARSLVSFLARFATGGHVTYRRLLEHLDEDLGNDPDSYLFHEYLEEHNFPLYFRELIGRADTRGLRYLAPASFPAWEHRLEPELAEFLRPLTRIAREQYLDFLCNRAFRRSLLCRAGASPGAEPSAEALAGLHVSGLARPSRPVPDIRSDEPEVFLTEAGDRLETNNPLVKTALLLLAEKAPGSISVASLWSQVRSRLGSETGPEGGPEELARTLLVCRLSNLVHLHVRPPRFAAAAGKRPQASLLARLQAARGEPIVNLCHSSGALSGLDQAVLSLLDGTRDRSAIAEGLIQKFLAGEVELRDAAGASVGDLERIRESVAQSLEPSLKRIAAAALLVGS